MKNILAILTSIIISLTVIPVAFASDVPSNWAEQEVAETIYLRFVPEELQANYTANITRAEFAKTAVFYLASSQNLSVDDFVNLYNAKSGIDLRSDLAFSDTDDYYVNKAYNLGVVNGRGEGIFDPDSPITRQEAAVMLLNAYRLFDMYANQEKAFLFRSGQVFSDSSHIDEWAIESAAIMYQFGVMNGVSADEWSPLGHYTREQCYATFLRLYKNSTRRVLLTYEEAVGFLMGEITIGGYSLYPTYNITTEFHLENYSIFHGGQSGVPGGSNNSLWIMYRSGGRREILHQWENDQPIIPSNTPRRNDIYIYDMAIDDDEATLTFKRDFNDITYSYSVDLATGNLTKIQ